MQIDKMASLLRDYRQRHVATVIDPRDNMLSPQQTIDQYDLVGESGLRVIAGTLVMSRKEAVYNVLDFGCGFGRVARYIRAMFPEVQLYLCDIDEHAREFCASQFGGIPIPSGEDFSQVNLPDRMDIIWVGSVFTHIDYERMEKLFDKLFGALGKGGLLIATFRGRGTYQMTKSRPHQAELYAPLLQAYDETGVGYQQYPPSVERQTVDWGLSLTSVEKVIALGKRHKDARLAAYAETCWANIHDVAAWEKC